MSATINGKWRKIFGGDEVTVWVVDGFPPLEGLNEECFLSLGDSLQRTPLKDFSCPAKEVEGGMKEFVEFVRQQIPEMQGNCVEHVMWKGLRSSPLSRSKMFAVSPHEPQRVARVLSLASIPKSIRLIEGEGEVLLSIPGEPRHYVVFFFTGPSDSHPLIEVQFGVIPSTQDTSIRELIVREDLIRCSSAFAVAKGRIQVPSLQVCLDRYRAELLYGLTDTSPHVSFMVPLRALWGQIQSLGEERIEVGCWCVDEPKTPFSLTKHESFICHAQVILQVIQSSLDVEIPANVFVVNVKKSNLSARNLSAEEWVACPNNIYVGYQMPFLPFRSHPLRNMYKVCPPAKASKRRSAPSALKGTRQKKICFGGLPQ